MNRLMSRLRRRRRLTAAIIVGALAPAAVLTLHASTGHAADNLYVLGTSGPSNPVWNQCVKFNNFGGTLSAVPVDEVNMCGDAARIGVSPIMALNAIGFASCMTERGQVVLATTVTPISIDFEYVPGVDGTSAAFRSTNAYCHANAVSLGNPVGLVYNYGCGSWGMPNTVAWAECELQGKA